MTLTMGLVFAVMKEWNAGHTADCLPFQYAMTNLYEFSENLIFVFVFWGEVRRRAVLTQKFSGFVLTHTMSADLVLVYCHN